MPLQNRVTPWGEIVADPARGMFLGNRGCLCDEAGHLAARRWRLKAWITCSLSWKGWWRPVMQPRVWTELFFLDEATALAAGHRPCALCRRPDYERFVCAWREGNGWSSRPKASEIDSVMHACRVRRDHSQIVHKASAAGLPPGAMVLHEGSAWLVQDGAMRAWSHVGYGPSQRLPRGEVSVLTPQATVATLAGGYRPVLHPSAT